ncbi:DUF2262 domain-containing protein [Anaerobiospirillum succiniciproducens]|uniref:DUF2262 domain-containing protein n=1 Tax=Anaerobiospirillum succiniciproducens TaxID=13335 RepID=UPI00248DDC79|nr:DUF2262 domain-containing protein [Anaerobiospirillum succiniciproducens]
MFDEFYAMYESTEHEVLALMGRCVGCSFVTQSRCVAPDVLMIGALFCDSGQLVKRAMHLHWPLFDKDLPNAKVYKRFAVGQVCRLKIRKLKDEFACDQHIPRYCLRQVISTYEQCPELMPLLEEYHKEVLLQDDILGTLKLDKDFEKFRGQLNCCKSAVALSIDVDAFAQESWTKTLNAAKPLVIDCISWDGQMRKYAAHKLSETYNDAHAHGCDDGDYEELSEEYFANKLTLLKLEISSDVSFKAYFDCDDIFFNSFVTVTGSVQCGFEAANVEER